MQVDKAILDNIPKNSYVIAHKDVDSEDHIIDKHLTTGARITADKFVKSIVSYVPKGMTGSKNSNFYEFLSMGMIPNLVGSAMLILISNAKNSKFGGRDSMFANMNGKKFAAGVVMYAAGKWLGNKIINKGVQAKTGIDLEMPYKKIVHELPEYKGDTDTTSVEFHKVYESVDFPRWDRINKQGEDKGNRPEYYDNAAKKMGYTKELNAPDQVVQPKIREVLVKSTASKAISSYVWAALGVAIASQEDFGNFMSFRNKPSIGDIAKKLPREIADKTIKSVKSLAKTKYGKALMFGAAFTSVAGILLSTNKFKADKEDKKSTVDYKSNYQEL